MRLHVTCFAISTDSTFLSSYDWSTFVPLQPRGSGGIKEHMHACMHYCTGLGREDKWAQVSSSVFRAQLFAGEMTHMHQELLYICSMFLA